MYQFEIHSRGRDNIQRVLPAFHNKTNHSLFFSMFESKIEFFNGLLVAVLKTYGENLEFCIAIKQLVHSKQTEFIRKGCLRYLFPQNHEHFCRVVNRVKYCNKRSFAQQHDRDVGNYLPCSSDLQWRVHFESKQSWCFAVFIPIAAQ